MREQRMVVIGAGGMGTVHAHTLERHSAVALAGICDPRPERRQLADELGVPFSTETEQLLARVSPDAAIIATPNGMHAECVAVCATHGVHCLVEKPIADSVAAADSIVAAAKQSGIQVLVGHHRRHSPRIVVAHDAVTAGRIGTIVTIAALWLVIKPDAYFGDHWRTHRPGGGPVLINLIHELDLLRYLCGEIEEVFAFASSAVRRLEVEDTICIALRFAGGAAGTITASDATVAPWSYELSTGENPIYHHVPGNCYYLAGTAGSLAIPSLELWSHTDGQHGWHDPLQREVLAAQDADPLLAQLDHFVSVVAGSTEPLVDAEDGRRSLAAALGVLESATTGRAIRLA